MIQAKALLVEDGPEFIQLSSALLRGAGFVVAVATNGERAVELAREHKPELILLDITLPGIDGIEVCRRIREFSDCYIVMLTARDEEFDRVLGLSVGADDYVTKPFSARELSARIQAMQRRPRVPERPGLRTFGPLSIDPSAREIKLDDVPVELTKIEFDILDLLSGNPRRTYERGQLMEAVWGGTWHGDDHVIDVHMGNLRKKLGESAGEQRFIRTVRGVGYRFDP